MDKLIFGFGLVSISTFGMVNLRDMTESERERTIHKFKRVEGKVLLSISGRSRSGLWTGPILFTRKEQIKGLIPSSVSNTYHH